MNMPHTPRLHPHERFGSTQQTVSAPEAQYKVFLKELSSHLHQDSALQDRLVEKEFTILEGVGMAFEMNDDEDDAEGVRVLMDIGVPPHGRELQVYAYLLQEQLRNLPYAEVSVGLDPHTKRLMLSLFLENIVDMADLYAGLLRQHLQTIEALRKNIAAL